MTNTELADRIKLAEAMRTPKETWLQKHGIVGPRDHIFDPFTDANDDYAVLEWMRGLGPGAADYGLFQKWGRQLPALLDYQIGDYARAALKVIDDD